MNSLSKTLKQLEQDHIMQTYKRFDIVLEKGQGCYVYDTNGRKYLDFVGGIATCSVGHANPEVIAAITRQAGQLISASNLYYSEPPIRLAHKLSQLSGLQKAFFCHSGAEANEAAIKLAKKITGKSDFIAFKDAFHGRTTGSLALTWKPELKAPFLPLSPYVSFADYGNVGSTESLITSSTAAIIVEPIQGEAGIVVPPDDFLKQLRDICSRHHILLIVDEVQTGVGRTGKFFAYQHAAIKPDIVTLAKGLANGLPIGACLSDYELERGEHGSTLGGNSLSAAAAIATIDYIERHRLVKHTETVGNYLMQRLREIQTDVPLIQAVRGRGLMIGIVLSENQAPAIVERSLAQGLLCNAAVANVIRLLPPLIVTRQQADRCVAILRKVMT